MSYQLVINGAVQHPGEEGIFYCCHFIDAKWAAESNEENLENQHQQKALTFLRHPIVMQVGVNNHLLPGLFW